MTDTRFVDNLHGARLWPFVAHSFHVSHPGADFQSVEVISEHTVSVEIKDSAINSF